MGMDMPFIIAASVSVRSGLAISIQLLIIHTIVTFAGFLIRRHLPFWQRVMAVAAISTLVMLPARHLVLVILPGVSDILGIYMFLLAVNAMTLLQASSLPKRAKFTSVMTGAVLSAVGFSIASVTVALVREIAGSGSIWGISLPLPFRLEGILLPFGGFVLMAFLLAATKFLNKKLLYLSLSEAERKQALRTRIRVISEEVV